MKEQLNLFSPIEEGFDFEVVSKFSKAIGYWFYAQESSPEQIDKFFKKDEQ